jgi:hypothetical protein
MLANKAWIWPSHMRCSAPVMHKLNHASLVYTKRYLGITDAELEAVIQRLNL